METISCIFCKSESRDVAITENGYNGRLCSTCRLIYISPRPSADEVINCYTHDNAAAYAEAQFGFENVNRRAARKRLDSIKRIRPSGALLELGPGSGFFLEEARRLGYDVHGIELNPEEAEWIRSHLKIPCEDRPLSPESFDGKRFDIIYHRDVISHLSDPLAVFCDTNRALNDNGLLVFETGNIGDLHRKYHKYFSQFLYPDHLFFFGERSIAILLERTGFTPLFVSRRAILLQLILQKLLWRLKDSLKDRERNGTVPQKRIQHYHPRRLNIKRHLRTYYRSVSSFLISLGTIVLPKTGRPLKLIVYAIKETARTPKG